MLDIELAKYIPWIPLIAAGLCGLCCCKPSPRKLAGPICVLSIFIPFLMTLGIYSTVIGAEEGTTIVKFFPWIYVGNLQADFGYYFDSLTLVMLFVVTGIGTLIATYAMGYMKGDRGYARFFGGVALFIFAMTTLVMADNLILLYLGWEGVGLCSYLLIGFYYDKPFAVAAAKKAFIVNRVGDLGFALGIFLCYMTFGSVQYDEIFREVQIVLAANDFVPTAAMIWIPFLLMIGAFGKSAQIPLYVWLPDAMAGPTPVSALVHAATMVTSGVYMIARLTPVFELSPYALPTLAVVGAVTSIFAATIALCSNDLKGVFAYSTVSQLGYMFLGVAVLSVGGIFHLMTHAFFKALLFLTAGSVMHALAGNLDIRTMSGLRKKMPVTCWLMFFGCLALAGFPFTAGFFSKDMILGDTMAKGLGEHSNLFLALAWIGIITAGITAFYTFRLWFKVFMGPTKWEMGDDHGDEHGHAHEPHEMPWWPMNLPLLVLAVGSIVVGYFAVHYHWIDGMLYNSTQLAAQAPAASAELGAAAAEHHGPLLFGYDTHFATAIISAIVAVSGILLAAVFHWWRRDLVAVVTRPIAPIVTLLSNKYYVDELYDMAIVKPLRGLGHLCYIIDDLIVNGLVMLVGWLPRLVGYGVRPTQHGKLQGYGVGMAVGLGMVVLVMFYFLVKAP